MHGLVILVAILLVPVQALVFADMKGLYQLIRSDDSDQGSLIHQARYPADAQANPKSMTRWKCEQAAKTR